MNFNGGGWIWKVLESYQPQVGGSVGPTGPTKLGLYLTTWATRAGSRINLTLTQPLQFGL